jgi:hypothetical protein
MSLSRIARSDRPYGDSGTCLLHAGSNSLDELALYIALKGFDFQVLDPPELIPVLRTLSDRLRQAADDQAQRARRLGLIAR